MPLFCLIVSLFIGCGGSTGGPSTPTQPGGLDACEGPYPNQSESPWVLPYPIGASYEVSIANCGVASHVAGHSSQYAYDFLMEIGSTVSAIRTGTVVDLREDLRNNEIQDVGGPDANFVSIQHPEGTFSHYVHLDQEGVTVEIGDFVEQGQVIARSGNSGMTTVPHLHFEVTRSGRSIPVTFLNTDPHPHGLVTGRFYTAEPY